MTLQEIKDLWDLLNDDCATLGEKLGGLAMFGLDYLLPVKWLKKLPGFNKLGNLSLGIQNSVGDLAKKIPNVQNRKLSNYVKALYKGANKGKDAIGTGSTADAVRNELKTGLPTGGKFHTQKAQQVSNGLRRWIRNNPDASDYDKLVAKSLLNDLQSALEGN